MNTPPSQEHVGQERIRLTITVTPEVHETFSRMAAATGMSLGKAMGEWLSDSMEAAQFLTGKLEEARAAPKQVMREMHAYALGLADETRLALKTVSAKGAPAAGKRSAAAGAQRSPRPVIRGGKSSREATGRKSGNRS